MERDANYAWVGAFALVLLAGLIAFSLWLARVSINDEYTIYDIVFVGPVTGLTNGGEVQFNGIKVGEVVQLDLDAGDPRKVIARASIESDIPIRTDSLGTLEPLGITGVNFVQISAGSSTQPLLRDMTPEGRIPVLRTRESALSTLIQGGDTVLTRTVESLDQIKKALSDDNIAKFSGTLANINSATAELDRQKLVLADARLAIQTATRTAQDISALTTSGQKLVDGDARKTLETLGAAAEQLRLAATDARTVMARLEAPTADVTNAALPQLMSAISTLQTSANSLDRLVGEIERDPRSFLIKQPAAEREVAP